jgi:NAD(P)H dehydrogenase (quinone)
MSNAQPTLLVTGASGQLGRRVVELLLESGAGNIIAATRTPEKLADLRARGVTVRQADFDDPASLEAAFAGVNRLLLISTDVAGQGDRRLNQHTNAVQAADKAGVKHLVYTSLMNPEPGTPVLLAGDHYGTETALAQSGLEWTVLRENLYAEVLIPTLSRAVQMGQLFSAIGDGKVAYIAREDVARAAAAALKADFSGRRTLDITGPEALSQADLAAITTSITGKQVAYIPLTLEAITEGMVNAGLPRPLAEAYASFDAASAQGLFSRVSSAVEELTGQKPIRIVDFLNAQRDLLVQGANTDPVEIS